MDLRKIGFGDVDWIHYALDSAGGGSCENGNEPSVSIKCGEFLD
jgi:hypothetical protein